MDATPRKNKIEPTAALNNASTLRRNSSRILWYLLLVVIVGYYELSSTVHKELPNTISCAHVQEHIDEKSWPDPNAGTYFIRRIKDAPFFYVSVHSQQYDPLRYNHVFINGRYYEAQVIQRFHRILSDNKKEHENSIVLDVGANIGYYTLLSASYQHTVYAFEINPANLMRVCESLSLNRWADNGHVHLYQRAVSRQSGDHLQIPIPNNPGAASIREIVEKGNMGRKRTTKTTTRSVATTTLALDDLARENGWLDDNSTVYIVLLKLDVEGAEPLVVEGAKALLKSGIVQNILTEAKNLGGAAMKQSMATILDAGYRIVRDDNLRNIRRLSLEESIKYLKYLEKHPGASGGLYNYDDLWFQLEESE